MYFLTQYQLEYILEELAILHGCVPNGLLFEVTDPTSIESVYIVYPRELDRAFAEGKKLFGVYNVDQKNPLLFEVNSLEVNLHEDSQGSKHYQAHIVKRTIIENLLQSKIKRLLFLISIGQDYHKDNYLEATVNLFANLIQGCVAIIKDEENSTKNDISKSRDYNNRLINLKGQWQIKIVVADSLQAYNEANPMSHIERYQYLGREWARLAEPVFQQLNIACGEVIPLSRQFVGWNELLHQASMNFNYKGKYDYLLTMYLAKTPLFYPSVVDKGLRHRKRQLEKQLQLTERELEHINTSHTDVDDRAILDRKQLLEKQIEDVKKELEKINKILKEIHCDTESQTHINNAPHDNAIDTISLKKNKNRILGFSNKTKTANIALMKEQHRLIRYAVFNLNHELANDHLIISAGKFNPPDLEKNGYIERKRLEDKIQDAFNKPPKALDAHHLILYGAGGTGKSSLAAHFYHCNKNEYTFRIWIAGNSLQNSFKDFGKALGLLNQKNNQDWMNIIFNWLITNPGWLLVVDSNIDDHEFIEKILSLPSSCGHLIVTTRHDVNWPQKNIRKIPVDVMSVDESKKLLQNCSQRLNEDFTELANRLGNLPIALKTAGAHLAINPSMTVSEYCQNEEFTNALRDKSISKMIAATYNISILAIDYHFKKGKGGVPLPFARDLLTVCSYLTAYNIIKEFLKYWFLKKYPSYGDLFNAVYQQLKRHLLIQEEYSGFIRVHPVLQDVMRAQAFQNTSKNQDNSILINEITDYFLEFSNKPMEYIYYHEHEIYAPHMVSILKHTRVLQKKDTMIKLLSRLGIVHKQVVGNPKLSNHYFQDAFGLLNNDSLEETAEIALHISKNCLSLQGKENITAAIKYATKSLFIYENQNPPNPNNLASVYNTLILCYSDCWDRELQAKKYEYTAKLVNISLKNPKSIEDNKSYILLSSFQNLLHPKIYFNYASINQALRNFVVILRYYVSRINSFHDKTILIELSQNLEKLTANSPQEYLKKIFLLIEKNSSTFRNILQDKLEHCVTFYTALALLVSLSSGAFTFGAIDKILLNKAIAIAREAESIWLREIKVDHPILGTIYNLIASNSAATEENENARIAWEYYLKSWHINKRNLGENHPYTISDFCMFSKVQAYHDPNFGSEQIFLNIKQIEQHLPALIHQEAKSVLPVCYAVLASLYVKLGAQNHSNMIQKYMQLHEDSLRDSDAAPKLVSASKQGSSLVRNLMQLTEHDTPTTNIEITTYRRLYESGLTFFNKTSNSDKARAVYISGFIAGCSPGIILKSPFVDSIIFSNLILKYSRSAFNKNFIQPEIGEILLTNIAFKLFELALGSNVKFLGLIIAAFGLLSILKSYINSKNKNDLLTTYKKIN